MKRRLLVISGIVLMMLITSISTIVVAEPNDIDTLGRTHIRAIGRFAICEEDEVLYGHIFFGFIGMQPVFNLDIEYSEDSIKWIVMSGFSINDVITYRFLNCVIVE